MKTISLLYTPAGIALTYCPKCKVVYYNLDECQCDHEEEE